MENSMEQLTACHLGIRILPKMFIQHSVADLVTNLVCRATEKFNEHTQKKKHNPAVGVETFAWTFLSASQTSSDPLLFICVDILMTRMSIKVDRIYLQSTGLNKNVVDKHCRTSATTFQTVWNAARISLLLQPPSGATAKGSFQSFCWSKSVIKHNRSRPPFSMCQVAPTAERQTLQRLYLGPLVSLLSDAIELHPPHTHTLTRTCQDQLVTPDKTI